MATDKAKAAKTAASKVTMKAAATKATTKVAAGKAAAKVTNAAKK